MTPHGIQSSITRADGMNMTRFFSRIRSAAGASAFVSCVLVCFLVACLALAPPAGAQQRSSDTAVNPTASSVKEQQLLREMSIISGRGTIPDVKSYNIEQPAGRDWRQFHQVTLRWIGAIAILGILAVLVIFYLIRGMVRLGKGRSGRGPRGLSRLVALGPWVTADCL